MNALQQRIREQGWIKYAMIGMGASLLLGLAAPIAFFLPWTPVPITIQPQLVMVLAALLGPKRGVWMVIAFLVEGAMGLPVFAGCAATVANMIGPRGGYLIGYLAAALLAGRSLILANLAIYACGLVWIAQFVGWERGFQMGIVPFIIPDLLKISVASALLHFVLKRKSG